MADSFISIDPGSIRTGFGVFSSQGRAPKLISSGVIHLDESLSLPLRLHQLAKDFEVLLKKHRPEAMALESVFFAKNARSTIQLGQARGVILMKAAEQGLSIYEYPPAQVKQAVTGSGRASKDQIEKMIRLLLRLPSKFQFETSDEADAIAVGFAHASLNGITKGTSQRDRASFWQTTL